MKIEVKTGGNVIPGTLLSEAFSLFEEKMRKDVMIQEIEKQTGTTGIVVILNGKVIQPSNYSSFKLNEGDDLRLHHPFFGG